MRLNPQPREPRRSLPVQSSAQRATNCLFYSSVYLGRHIVKRRGKQRILLAYMMAVDFGIHRLGFDRMGKRFLELPQTCPEGSRTGNSIFKSRGVLNFGEHSCTDPTLAFSRVRADAVPLGSIAELRRVTA